MLDTAVVGIAQWLAAPGAPEQNLEAALGHVGRLAASGCDLIALPELWPCGYDPAGLEADARDAAEPLGGPRIKLLGEAARAAGAWVAAGSVPELDGDAVYNTAVLFSQDGELHATHRKVHLYGAAERRAFAPGERLTTCETDDLDVVGLCVCFDGDFPEVARWMGSRGARVVLDPGAYEVEAETWWDRLYPATAMVNGQWWIMANQAGALPSITLLGGSQIVSPLGDVVARAPRARAGETLEPHLLVARVDLRAEIERADRELGVLRELRRPDLYGDP